LSYHSDRGETLVVLDYGMSNLFSVSNALASLGVRATVTARPEELAAADRAILPGVGAFGAGMRNLRERGLDTAIRDFARSGRPLLGICLGMQLLATKGHEHGDHEGLGIVPGTVVRLPTKGGARVPHIGWNTMECQDGAQACRNLGPRADFYFVHSYHMQVEDEADVCGWCEHSIRFVAAVERGAVMGTQFHPEKSHRAGLTLLKNFLALPPC